MRARHVLAIAVVLTAAGCTKPAVTMNSPVVPTPALPACSAVFQPGKVVDKAKASGGCTDPSGGVQGIGMFSCSDGSVLWQVDANTGAKAGYAREGKPYVAVKGDGAADPGYKKAYEACNG